MIILFAASCAGANRSPRLDCAPVGEMPCGLCTEPGLLSPAAKARLAIDAHGALLRAELKSGLLTGYPIRPDERRFFLSDTGATEFVGVVEVPASPGRAAEIELVKGPLNLTVFHLALTTRQYSGRDGILVDVDRIERSWIAGDERLFEESFSSYYCVVRTRDGHLRIEQVGIGVLL